MFTARNIFIANMAISDILLCSFTMPFTLLDVITKHWSFGHNMVRTSRKTDFLHFLYWQRPTADSLKTVHTVLKKTDLFCEHFNYVKLTRRKLEAEASLKTDP